MSVCIHPLPSRGETFAANSDVYDKIRKAHWRWISASSDDGCVKKTSETEYQFRFLDWCFSPHRQYLTVNIILKKIWIVTYQINLCINLRSNGTSFLASSFVN